MRNFVNTEKISKMLYKFINNRVIKWNDKSMYHANKINGYIANKNTGYMHKYEIILNRRHIKYHSRMANYYKKCAMTIGEGLERMKIRAQKLNIKLD